MLIIRRSLTNFWNFEQTFTEKKRTKMSNDMMRTCSDAQGVTRRATVDVEYRQHCEAGPGGLSFSIALAASRRFVDVFWRY